ncbi:hypothetical protein ACLK1T_06660 [Escherichia coli]
MPLNFRRLVMSSLAECAPTFACYGNHNRPVGTKSLIGETLKSVGIAVLFKTRLQVIATKTAMRTGRPGDLSAGQCKTASASEQNLPRLMLVHNPAQVMRDEPWESDAVRPSHGGQLRVPLVGEPFAPVEDEAHHQD